MRGRDWASRGRGEGLGIKREGLGRDMEVMFEKYILEL